MTSLLVRNIARIAGIERHGRLMLAGRDLSVMESIEDAFLYVEDGVIADFGPMSELADKGYADDAGVNAGSSRRFATRTPIWSLPAAGSGNLSTKSMA